MISEARYKIAESHLVSSLREQLPSNRRFPTAVTIVEGQLQRQWAETDNTYIIVVRLPPSAGFGPPRTTKPDHPAFASVASRRLLTVAGNRRIELQRA